MKRTPLVVAIAVVALLLSWGRGAWAGSRVVLLQFEGRKAEVLRDKVARSFEQSGHSVVLSKSPSEGTSKVRVRRLAKRAGADVVVAGHVRRHSIELWSVRLTLRDGRGEKIGKEIRFKSSWLPGLAKALTDTAGRRLTAALGGEGGETTPASDVWDADADSYGSKGAVEAGDDDGDDASVESLFEVDSGVIPERDDGGEAPRPPAEGAVVHLRARGGLVRRTLDYVDDIYGRLRTQRANIWVYHVEGALYPFARPIGERLGVIASYESVFAGSVRDTDFGANFEVDFSEAFAGIRARHPFGDHQLGFDLTFGTMTSGLLDQGGAARSPDLRYTLLRSALDVTVDLGRVRVMGAAGFRLPLGYGEISDVDWFPRIGGYGVEAAAGVDYPISKTVSVEVNANMRRFVLEMNSEPLDAMEGVSEVAGGAIDLYLSGYLGMTFRL